MMGTEAPPKIRMNLEQRLIYTYLQSAGKNAKLLVAEVMVSKGIQKWTTDNYPERILKGIK